MNRLLSESVHRNNLSIGIFGIRVYIDFFIYCYCFFMVYLCDMCTFHIYYSIIRNSRQCSLQNPINLARIKFSFILYSGFVLLPDDTQCPYTWPNSNKKVEFWKAFSLPMSWNFIKNLLDKKDWEIPHQNSWRIPI